MNFQEPKAQRQMRDEQSKDNTEAKLAHNPTLLYALSAAEQINQPAIAGKYIQCR
jgi:hypothetical protein